EGRLGGDGVGWWGGGATGAGMQRRPIFATCRREAVFRFEESIFMSVRQEIALLVDAAAREAQAAGELPQVALPEPAIERPARPEHGDYASSLPLRLSRTAPANPLALPPA